MPGADGISFCRQVRDRLPCPIVFLSAMTEESSKLLRLASGGDDYITKPFRVRELYARVEAHLRRESRPRMPTVRVRFGPLWIDYGARESGIGSQPLNFTKKEFEIAYLYANAPTYRKMTDSAHIRLGSGDGTFYRFTNRQISYERYVFSAAQPSILNLTVKGRLETGRFSLWLVSPDGTTVHQTDVSEAPDEQISAAVTPGLWSLILINHYDRDYQIAGTLSVRGEITAGS